MRQMKRNKMIDQKEHLLIIDDDQRICLLLKKFLCKVGYRVTVAYGSMQVRQLLKSMHFDLLVCDVMMPGEDGISLTKFVRDSFNVPIILLTAKSDTKDRISGLEAGSDDYISKPFEPQELLLRIQAILRRIPSDRNKVSLNKFLRIGPFIYKMDRGELWHGSDLIRLTTTEIMLMQIFSRNPNIAINRTRLVEELGRDRGQAQERAIDVQITRLRRKIESDPKSPRYLQTVRSAGYMFVPD
jgi:two-component system phosphate regulon response regulator OmpR